MAIEILIRSEYNNKLSLRKENMKIKTFYNLVPKINILKHQRSEINKCLKIGTSIILIMTSEESEIANNSRHTYIN